MKILDRKTRSQILYMLCEGNSIRAVTRLTGASKNTVTKLLIDAGKACAAYHDENVRNVQSKRVQADEIWSFTYAKQKNVAAAKAAPDGAGDTWTWTALDADSKMILSYFVGGRDGECAMWFVDDLRTRLANRVQLSSDGHKAYLEAVEGAFGGDVDYAILHKVYGAAPDGTKGRYSPAECVSITKNRIEGDPDPAHVSTSCVERHNLTMQMHMRRFTRLTNAFSKKVENHAYAVALHMMYQNFVKVHSKLRMSPAMAAGVSQRLWEIDDVVGLVEAEEARADRKRGTYKKGKNQSLEYATQRVLKN
ncbi:IS1 family transposase [Aestuariivirga sp.]|uniref:IS1 family transposase n=1 Tax=Aestuariivirga sp. TaxID=2650926 RepID=UPI0025BBCB90|nr:IS1 family transposase [Aestuariivirga sp.]MCA3555741.1 IS1 family transposase [Aestuariivirga sp.]